MSRFSIELSMSINDNIGMLIDRVEEVERDSRVLCVSLERPERTEDDKGVVFSINFERQA